MSLSKSFDAVLMLTWSDWGTEHRGNRYHYAIRFAREVPVLFFQNLDRNVRSVEIEASGFPNIDLLKVGRSITEDDVSVIRTLLAARGIQRPLFWIYDSLNYQSILDAFPNVFRVYHATEDYLLPTTVWAERISETRESVVRLLSTVDFLVLCSEFLVSSYLTLGGYKGPYVVIENGCDAEFFFDYAQVNALDRSIESLPVAIYQGGINQRLDYDLISDLVLRMPSWEFHFCGPVLESKPWRQLLLQPNVRYLGELTPEGLARQMSKATVGIIPFVQDQWIRNSLPLKAYEYVACGLPVVTVPIMALRRDATLFAEAVSSKEFAEAMIRLRDSRFEPSGLEARRSAASAASYNKRYAAMCESLLVAKATVESRVKKLKVAILHDCMRSPDVDKTQRYLEGFSRFSHHFITYIPTALEFWNKTTEEICELVDFSHFDVVILDFSVRLSCLDSSEAGLLGLLQSFSGLKVLFDQSNIESLEQARIWIERINFHVVYTTAASTSLNKRYPTYRFPSIEFISIAISAIDVDKRQNNLPRKDCNAHDEFVLSEEAAFRDFIKVLDETLERRVIIRNSVDFLIGLFSVSSSGSLLQVLPILPPGVATKIHPLGRVMSLDELAGAVRAAHPAKSGGRLREAAPIPDRMPSWVYRALARFGKRGLRWIHAQRTRDSFIRRLAQHCWRSLTPSAQIQLLRIINLDRK